MRIAGIIITSIGAIGGIGLLAEGDYLNGIIGGLIFIILGIIMILKGKSRAEIREIKASKQQEKQAQKEKKQQEKQAQKEKKQQEKQAQKEKKQQQQAELKAQKQQIREAEKAKKQREAEEKLRLAKEREEALLRFEPTSAYAIAPTGLFLSEDELCFFQGNVEARKDKQVTTGYSGGSKGVNVRVAKGVSIRMGGSKGSVNKKTVTERTPGTLYITNKRIVHLSEKNGFDKKLTALSAINFYADAIQIQIGQKNYTLFTNEARRIAVVIQGLTNK